jgi:hypothetical protein
MADHRHSTKLIMMATPRARIYDLILIIYGMNRDNSSMYMPCSRKYVVFGGLSLIEIGSKNHLMLFHWSKMKIRNLFCEVLWPDSWSSLRKVLLSRLDVAHVVAFLLVSGAHKKIGYAGSTMEQLTMIGNQSQD